MTRHHPQACKGLRCSRCPAQARRGRFSCRARAGYATQHRPDQRAAKQQYIKDMQANQPEAQVGKELVHLFGIAHPAHEIDIAGSAKYVGPDTRQNGQHIAIIDHAQTNQAGHGKTAQRRGGQPLADSQA